MGISTIVLQRVVPMMNYDIPLQKTVNRIIVCPKCKKKKPPNLKIILFI